jgi:phosphonoacetaldehyde hydrolase
MKIPAVIFDWAGTTVDFGCRAPVEAIREAFASFDVPLSAEEARGHMGLPKLEHIRATCADAAVAARWAAKYGARPTDADVERIYTSFLPMQLAAIERYSRVIPGVAPLVAHLRARGVRVGSTTGYTREMLDVVMKRAACEGYAPEASVTPEEAGLGRPAPLMCYLNAVRLRAYPLRDCVKIGDTVSDIEEGRNAGMWTIGIAVTGNEVGLSEEEWKALGGEERERRAEGARRRLLDAGADFVADRVGECEGVIEEIERGLTLGA